MIRHSHSLGEANRRRKNKWVRNENLEIQSHIRLRAVTFNHGLLCNMQISQWFAQSIAFHLNSYLLLCGKGDHQAVLRL